MFRWTLLALLVWTWFGAATAGAQGRSSPSNAPNFLPPDQAFVQSLEWADAQTVRLTFLIAPGYYLYRDRFQIESAGKIWPGVDLPPGQTHFDTTFGRDMETYRTRVEVLLPWPTDGQSHTVQVQYQGCADQGLCYPPLTTTVEAQAAAASSARQLSWTLDPTLAHLSAAALQTGTGAPFVPPLATAADTAPPTAGSSSAWDFGTMALASRALLPTVVAFFVGGVLLSLTPCVLPMLPILSAILTGDAARQGAAAVPRGRSFFLALSYALGMATVYTALGVAAGLAGEGLAAHLQSPWMLTLMSLALVAAALSLFGVYELQLPSFLRERVGRTHAGVQGGRYASVFVLGGLSAILVSPCVAAPLAGALVYISQTRDVVLGGSALFALAMGMSVPLLLLGLSAGRWLPRSGAWMEDVKRFFGLLLLGVALWTAEPLLSSVARLMLWGLWMAFAAVWVWPQGATRSAQHLLRQQLRYTVGACLAFMAALQWVGAVSGAHDPTAPLEKFTTGVGRDAAAATRPLPFQAIADRQALDSALAQAQGPVMLDFTATWCKSCIEMERHTFADPVIAARLKKGVLLQVDVTDFNDEHRALLKRYGLFGPPGLLFFNPQGGGERVDGRLVGYEAADLFGARLDRLAWPG